MTTPHNRPAGSEPTAANHPPPPRLDELLATVPNAAGFLPKAEQPATHEMLAPPAAADELGRVGHFRVLKLLGSGGMGMVFLAEDQALGRQVALKIMKPRADDQELAGLRFLNEARAIAKIKHDNLVTIYQVGQEGNTFYYAMELLAGETLESRIKRGQRWQIGEILRIGQELASGLAAMHEHGLIHRDIKPSNIWLETRGEGQGARGEYMKGHAPRVAPHPPRAKILDFGLVRDVNEEIALTETGIVMGTPAFMSPEQVRAKKVDARSDLYSFGCILYRLCTGRYPHEATGTMAQLAAVVADEPTAASELNPALPPALARLVMQLLAKNPEDRPQSAAAVAERLKMLREGLAEPNRSVRESADNSSLDLSYDTSELRLQPPSFLQRHWRKLLLAGGAGACMLAFGLAALLLVILALPHVPGLKKGPPPPPPPAAEAEVKFLSEMKPVQAVSWPFFGKKEMDKDKGKKQPKGFEFDRLSVNGEPSPHGIFMHAAPPFAPPASLSYQLDKRFKTFLAKVSLADSSNGSNAAIRFAVYADGKRIWESKPVWTRADTQDVNLDVADVNLLKLEVAVQGEDVGGAHGAWVEPRLIGR